MNDVQDCQAYGTAEYWKRRYFLSEEAGFRARMMAIAGWVGFVIAVVTLFGVKLAQ